MGKIISLHVSKRTSYQCRHKLLINQCQTNGQNHPQTSFNEDQITSITVFKAESMLTNVYLQNILHVKFLYVFTIYAQIYIIVVKLITIRF